MPKREYKRRPVLHRAALLLFLAVSIAVVVMVHPETPLAPAWNPTKPLEVSDPLTLVTKWKLAQAFADDSRCVAALKTGARASREPDLVVSGQCGISPRVSLDGVAGARMSSVSTRCQTALRLAMWVEHGLQPAAREILGSDLSRIEHFSSYSCRAIRSGGGETGRISSHATADAIDISGFVTENGTDISLARDWDGNDSKSAFLRRAYTSACDWFRVTLGPTYNALHADHFHLQHSGRGLCR